MKGIQRSQYWNIYTDFLALFAKNAESLQLALNVLQNFCLINK